MKLFIALVICSTTSARIAIAETASKLNTQKIETLTGLKGNYNEKEEVFKVSYPRNDIQSTSNGVKLAPGLGLTSWVAFQKFGKETMLMGDTVLLEDQVGPVMSVALDNGLEVTALHNHFFGDSPKVMFMHIGGLGDEEQLATAIGKVYAKLKETAGGKGSFPITEIDPAKSTMKTEVISKIFGTKGDLKDGIYKVTIGRKTKMHDHEVGNAMGVNTWAAFAGSDIEAVVDGDFAMLENELQTVLKTLRHANINIVAIHNHMTMETPRIMYLHFWGVGKPEELAKALKAALDTQKMLK